METIALQLEKILEQYKPGLYAIGGDSLVFKPAPHRWSKKELIGHMVDSAQNNIRRFIVARYEENPYIVYDQDKWVAISNYQNYDSKDLVDLWYLLNKHITIILRNTSDETAQRTCSAQSQETIEWFARDYIKHLLHHLHQVLELEPVAYP